MSMEHVAIIKDRLNKLMDQLATTGGAISSGLGSDGGFRMCNTPEIVLFELKCTEGK